MEQAANASAATTGVADAPDGGLTRRHSPAAEMVASAVRTGERFIEWNFVSSSKERIEQAKADWRAGRMKLPDLDDAEFIPLPSPPPPANPMS